MKHYLSLLMLLLTLSCVAAQPPVYVRHNATGQNNGASWTDAYTDLQTAIDSAAEDSELWVAAGVYVPGKKLYNGTQERDKSFLIDKPLKLYGGFVGTETVLTQRQITDTTTLSAQLNDSIRAHHVMVIIARAADTVIIDRFTVRDGNGADEDYSIPVKIPDSLGINIDNTTGTRYNTISTTTGSGIYIYAQDSAAVTVTGSYFTNNYSLTRGVGGGVMALLINSAYMLLDGNHFFSNKAYESGGAAMVGSLVDSVRVVITDNFFKENKANSGTGGGIEVDGGNAYIAGNRFIGNTAYYGGGISLHNVLTTSYNAIVTDNYFEGNESEYGGGLYLDNGMHMVGKMYITNNTFYRNKALFTGGGLSVRASGSVYDPKMFDDIVIVGNRFLENQAANYDSGLSGNTYGGGMSVNVSNNSRCSIADNLITGNSADNGGGIYIDKNRYTDTQHSNITLYRNRITGNTATQDGGGIYALSANIKGNYIARNSADKRGGGCYIASDDVNGIPVLKDNLITGNTATQDGGGVYAVAYRQAKVMLANNTIAGNTGAHTGGIYLRTERQSGSTGTIQAYNNLVWGNAADNFAYDNQGTLHASHNLIQEQTAQALNAFGSGNLDGTTANPTAHTALLFADYTAGNYSLKSTSICIDAGVDSLYRKNVIWGDSLDIAGMPRFHGASIDIGAYEYHDTYIVVSVPDNDTKGTTTGSGFFPVFKEDTLTATPNTGYEIAYWKDTLGNIVSYNDTIILTVIQDTTLIAYFRPEGTNSDASLLSLTPSAGVLSPVFSSDIYQYTDTVPYAVDSIRFYAQTTDAQAVINASDTVWKPLAVGDNIFSVRVTSSDGWETAEYFVHVYRLNNNAYLHELSVTNTELSPAFDSAHYVYSDTVEYAVSQVDISAVLSDPKAELSGDTGIKNLTVGWNNFSLLVRAEDRDTTRTYTINIYRKTEFEDTDAWLLSLIINGNEQLSAPVNNYNGYYEGACAEAEFQIALEIPDGAMLSIDNDFTHTITKLAGQDTINFTITSKDGSTTTSHQLILERRLPFEEYVEILWSYNTLMLDIKKTNADGLDIEYGTHYRWYRNGIQIQGMLPTYSAGPKASDRLENGAYYYLQIKTLSGETVRTCEQLISYDEASFAPQATTVSVYPNPVKSGEDFYVELDEKEFTTGTFLEIYNMTGICIERKTTTENPVKLNIAVKGLYIVRVNGKMVDKIIVK